MHFFRLPSNAAAAACRSRQRPRASSARLRSRTRGSSGLLLTRSPAIRKWQGRTRPQPSRCLATTVGSCARLLPVVREVSRGSRRPSAVSGMPLPSPKSATWRTVPCPVHLPGRRGILAAWHVGRGNPRPGRVAPTDAGLLQARPASRTTGCSPVHGRSCYGQRRIASTRPGRPGLPGGPGEAVKGRHQSAAHYTGVTGVISGSPAKFPARARRHRGRAGFGAPSLPDCRHPATRLPRRHGDLLRQATVVTCRPEGSKDSRPNQRTRPFWILDADLSRRVVRRGAEVTEPGGSGQRQGQG